MLFGIVAAQAAGISGGGVPPLPPGEWSCHLTAHGDEFYAGYYRADPESETEQEGAIDAEPVPGHGLGSLAVLFQGEEPPGDPSQWLAQMFVDGDVAAAMAARVLWVDGVEIGPCTYIEFSSGTTFCEWNPSGEIFVSGNTYFVEFRET